VGDREMIINISNLGKVYKNGKISVSALKNVDLSIYKGEFISIMGPSGSGKSTLMNIIGCLDRATSGSYQLDGIDISKLDEKALAKIRNLKIGFVFQSFNLLPRMTALRNVELPMIYAGIGAKERRKRAIEALERVALKDRMSHKPNEMSGGQKQRVAIARALVNKPKIILADEPTGNLDSYSSEEVMAVFQDLNKEGVTIILVTHEPDIAEHTKRFVKFRDGLMVEDKLVENPIDAREVIKSNKMERMA
jgi:putative ABC transport system ATP-binding protein